MADVVLAVQNAIGIVGKLRELSQKIHDVEFRTLVADLAGELADAKMELAEIKTQLALLKEENQKLKSSLAQRSSERPVLKESCYEFAGEEGLYCTGCFDTKGQKVRVSLGPPDFAMFGVSPFTSSSTSGSSLAGLFTGRMGDAAELIKKFGDIASKKPATIIGKSMAGVSALLAGYQLGTDLQDCNKKCLEISE